MTEVVKRERGEDMNEELEQTQVEEKRYPLPGSKDKPLKIDASELEAIILIPKGVRAEYPIPREEAKDTETKPDAETEEKIKALTSENEALKKQVEEITMSLKEHIVDDILEIKEKKQLTREENEREKYMQLDVDALKVLLSELKELKVGSKPEPKAKKTELTDDTEAKKREIRKKLFGIEDLEKEGE